MKNRKFNPFDWLDKPNIVLTNNTHLKEQNKILSSDNLSDVEIIISRIEESKIDITASYNDWLNIGFAFADEFGENGRNYFHKISQFYPDYSEKNANNQFNECLKSNGKGINIKTFYFIAKQAGINISVSKSKDNETILIEKKIFNTPYIPVSVYHHLPEILKESTNMFKDNTEKDVFLIGAISVLSACLPNIQGIYFEEPVSTHLYSFITAPAGSGKGKLKWAKYFGLKIHKTIVEKSKLYKQEYDKEIEDYNNLNKNLRKDTERPIEPKHKMFFIPANSSSSAFIQALSDNDFKGLVFENEADTLSNTLKQDWGNFSDVLRKAFHHESTNMFRRKDNEYIEIDDPHLAIVLSGTPKQISNMIPDVENGLFSRFLYYAFEDSSDFKNPFISYQDVNYVDFFNKQGQSIFDLYQNLISLNDKIIFSLTNEQANIFTSKFKTLFKRNKLFLGNDFNANSRRLGLITFRIAMILSALSIIETGDISKTLLCSDTDFNTAISIATTLEKHAIAVFKNLPNNNLKGAKLKFFENLPLNFNRQEYLKIANNLNIKEKTAEKYISLFCQEKLFNHQHNKYSKIINK